MICFPQLLIYWNKWHQCWKFKEDCRGLLNNERDVTSHIKFDWYCTRGSYKWTNRNRSTATMVEIFIPNIIVDIVTFHNINTSTMIIIQVSRMKLAKNKSTEMDRVFVVTIPSSTIEVIRSSHRIRSYQCN